jgi:thymidylate synthase (FAD)
MTNEIKVLDYGYVRLVECWGHGDAGYDIQGMMTELPTCDYECGIIEAARQSTQGSFRGWDTDEKLLSYLFNGKPQHATPFEFSGMIIEVQAPIFIFREWHRHRTQSYNEMSARYAPLPNLNYIPTVERLMRNSKINKQAGTIKEAEELTEEYAETFRKALVIEYSGIQAQYELALQRGVPKELARIILPVARYSKMRASANLRNWLAFVTLRSDPNAMWEIQEFSRAVESILKDKFPRTYDLFLKRRGDA